MSELTTATTAAALSLVLLAGPCAASAAPALLAELDDAAIETATGCVAFKASVVEGERGAPSPAATRLEVPELAPGSVAGCWIARRVVTTGFDGVSFWIRGTGKPGHVEVVLQPEGDDAGPRFVSRVLMSNPLWHRVFLPLSEFYDPASPPAALRRFDAAAGPHRIGLRMSGPTSEPRSLAIDALGLSTQEEVDAILGWPTYMPPSHGFPPYLESFEGTLAWRTTGGAQAGAVPLEDFPHEGFRRGMLVQLPTLEAAASRELDAEPLPFYEGFGFWVKGDGVDRTVDVTLAHGDGEPFVFTILVRGSEWKLVFAGFENFKRGREEFEVEEPGAPLLGLRLRGEQALPARLLLGPIRLGYEK